MSAYTVPEGSYDTGRLYHPTEQGYARLTSTVADAGDPAPASATAGGFLRSTRVPPPTETSVLVVSGTANVGPTLAFLDSLAAAPFMPYWR
jgi:hypothetical protein